MLGRLRVLLIVALVGLPVLVLPVTVNLRDGLIWSKASAQGFVNWQLYPYCRPFFVNYYRGARKLRQLPNDWDYWDVPSGCAYTSCGRRELCISEVNSYEGHPEYTEGKLANGCTLRHCTGLRFGRYSPYR